MKKLSKLFLSIAALFTMTSCNLNLGIGSLTFTKVHITTKDYSGCVDIESWRDDEMGIEVKTKEYGSLFLSEGTYILVSDKCPICNKD